MGISVRAYLQLTMGLLSIALLEENLCQQRAISSTKTGNRIQQANLSKIGSKHLFPRSKNSHSVVPYQLVHKPMETHSPT